MTLYFYAEFVQSYGCSNWKRSRIVSNTNLGVGGYRWCDWLADCGDYRLGRDVGSSGGFAEWIIGQVNCPARSYFSNPLSSRVFRLPVFMVIASAEKFLKPCVEDYKNIATAHFFKPKFCGSAFSVSPRYWDYGPWVTSYNCLKRQLDSEIEMWCKQRTTSFNHWFPISLKCVCCVVQSDAKYQLNKLVC